MNRIFRLTTSSTNCLSAVKGFDCSIVWCSIDLKDDQLSLFYYYFTMCGCNGNFGTMPPNLLQKILK